MDEEKCGKYINGMLFSHKKEALPFAILWMDLDRIMLSEISQTKTNAVRPHLYVESKSIVLVGTGAGGGGNGAMSVKEHKL